MSEKTLPYQTVSNSMYTPYPTSVPMTGSAYQAMHGQGIVNPLSNFQGMRAALSAVQPSPLDLSKANRLGQHTPMMVMPSGQTVPLSAFYSQGNNADNGLSYVAPNMMSGLAAGAGYTGSFVPQYNWPYGMPGAQSEVDLGRRSSWVGDENIPLSAGSANATQQECYGSYPYTHPATTFSQHYTPGPIQPMKTSDNKGYEMVNLDELVTRDPAIPRAVPALWTNQEDLTLAKCLQNPEGITNIYIRGFMPETADEDLERWASRFGEIESCKAIIDQDTGKCKGFGFVMYYSPAAAENCIRGFFHLGFQASYAQKSRNSRLKDLEDRTSTNIYCTGVPIDWNESHLAKHFLPYHAVSTKICRDSPSGVSKEVGFARFETRDIAEHVLRDFHSVPVASDNTKLYLRFADTKAQKQLKLQSQERRQWRSREYSYSVEHTPSPLTGRFQSVLKPSPNDSYPSPAGAGNSFTPATSVSPPEIATNNSKAASGARNSAWPTSGGLQTINSQTQPRSTVTKVPTRHYVRPSVEDASSTVSGRSGNINVKITKTPSPKKVVIKVEPATEGKENVAVTPPAK